MSETYFIVDGSGWLYRAFHALPPLTSPDGQPTNAIYGLGNMLRRLLREHDPQHIVLVFDAPGKTFRHEMYADYKAHRPPVPPELKEQFEPIVELVGLLGVPLLQINDVEADDVMATLAAQAPGPVRIVSSDKDMTQIVDQRVNMLDVFKNRVIDPAAVSERYGVQPEQIADWLALVGDSSDNVPGLPGVGPKTATKWLLAHDNLDGIVSNAGQIKGKAGQTLRDHQEQLRLSRELTGLRTDVDLPRDWSQLQRKAADDEGLQAFARTRGFRSWLQAPAEPGPSTEQAPATGSGQGLSIDCQLVQTSEDLQSLCKELKAAPIFAVDTETSGLDSLNDELIGLSFAVDESRAWYVPVGHQSGQQLPLKEVAEALAPLLAAGPGRQVLQNGKFDAPMLARHGMPLASPWHDTQLASYVYEAHLRHDMDTLAERWLGHQTIKYSDVTGKGRKQIPFAAVDLEAAANYAGEDAAVTLALHKRLQAALEADAKLQEIYALECALAPVLAAMEARGISMDRETLNAADRDFSAEIDAEEAACHELAGHSFNLGSPGQLATILFDELELPVLRKTPKGAPSTAEDVLEELAAEHELPRRILRWRMLSKLRSTYTRALDAAIRPDTGRVHCRFQQAVASTGRLSCADPNLQNIPIRRPEGRRIREAFVAAPGKTLLALDYSQIELRLMAHFSEDPVLTQAFADGVDIHARTAAQVWELDESTVTPDQRRAAKAINFGLIYGISAFGLARNLGISRTEADDIMQRFFRSFSAVADYMERVKENARDSGEVRTLRGRRLTLPDIKASNAARRQGAERVAINAPLQGTAADIIKQAMLDIEAQIGTADDVQMLLQVHDELVFEVDQSRLEHYRERLSALMCKAASLRVPLVVDAGHGRSWAEAHA